MFHKCSITNHDCYEKTALFYTFRSKQTRGDADAEITAGLCATNFFLC
jgi:hypothetical protein